MLKTGKHGNIATNLSPVLLDQYLKNLPNSSSTPTIKGGFSVHTTGNPLGTFKISIIILVLQIFVFLPTMLEAAHELNLGQLQDHTNLTPIGVFKYPSEVAKYALETSCFTIYVCSHFEIKL